MTDTISMTDLAPGQYERIMERNCRMDGKIKEAKEWAKKAQEKEGPGERQGIPKGYGVPPLSVTPSKAVDLPPDVYVEIKLTEYRRKAYVASWGIVAKYWDMLPGWESRAHLEREHEQLWPYSFPKPTIQAGNDSWHPDGIKISKDDLHIFGYGAAVAWWAKNSFNLGWTEWAFVWATMVGVIDEDYEREFRRRMKSMRMTLKDPGFAVTKNP